MESVAVITGANRYVRSCWFVAFGGDLLRVANIFFHWSSGIGLSLAQRLLSELPERVQRVCLACRNMGKAEAARRKLLHEHPGAKVDLVQLDTSSTSSVRAAAAELCRR